MKELLLVDKNDLIEMVRDVVDDAFQKGFEAANDRYVGVNEAAAIMCTSTKKVYRDLKNNRFVHVLENPTRILKSEILQKI